MATFDTKLIVANGIFSQYFAIWSSYGEAMSSIFLQNSKPSLLGEKKVEGKKKKKNNAKFSGHYVRQHTHNVHAYTLCS